MKIVSAFLIGLVFGIGFAISGMTNPAKVLNFFDIAGTWDPSLIFVMAGSCLTAAVGYFLIFRRMPRPVLDTRFHLPESSVIDARLVGGSALFGVGWGIAGFCPGGAIPALGMGHPAAFVFTAAMIAGILIARLMQATAFKSAAA